ncbi:THUMP domain-containing class I SAM-dependent RNA methyltransferase [Adhaeribacter pallidiroseus]|uniref:Ribosomal RNA large subunit methyltransferase K/L n=1 Tax=Adhaeribacter pallidiroseus TaxID=2072847 RepID=A0A369QGW4_9BACT|nr:THUMP domain-containing protein [Adhaeribacter pallidiroseus]RDC63672.1 Ribosomal RNA large subunit methyltransferase K/L [Adhaeribacter pallidiroseus]
MTASTTPPPDFSNYIATTLFGLEEILAQELADLGAQNIYLGNRAVEFAGDKSLLYRANLWCRTAIRILKPFRTFKARDERDLYRQVSKINWADYLQADQTFAIQSVVNQSSFEHSLFVSQLTKDAIVDQFRQRTGQRPSVDVERPDVRLNLHMHENFVTLALDASGDSLHRRGYRLQTNVAPLSEVLAAGIILLTAWDKKSPFIDPMCGSGTFLTEAALLAHNIAPGLYRRHSFGFMNWPDFDEPFYRRLVAEAEAARLPEQEVTIMGSDIDKDYIEAARSNITNADLDDYIRIRVRDIKEVQGIGEKGIVLVNPPYGERIIQDNLNQLYKTIGDTFKTNFSGYDAFVFTGNLEAAKHIGLKTSRRIPLYNGPIECRLLKYELYRGTRKIKEEPKLDVI